MPEIQKELIERRSANSKTFDLGNGRRRAVLSGAAVHYKDNYADESEQWKDIDLTIRDGKLTTAPYELTIDGKKLTFKDKKTGEVSTLELLSVSPPGVPFEIKPFNEGVSFRHTLPADKIPFQAQFRVTGNFRTRAFDDAGELELETSFKDGVLTEKLSQVKDKTGKARAAVGNIRIDPILTVQPSAKDNNLDEDNPDTVIDVFTLDVQDPLGYAIRPILEFDMSEVPADQTLISANLHLYYNEYFGADPVGKTIWAYKLTRTDWAENWVSWNIYKQDSSWTNAGGDFVTTDPVGGSTVFPGSYDWMTWNVLAIIQNAYDNTISAEFLVKFDDDGLTEGGSLSLFWSSDYFVDTDLCPKLVIEYEPAVGVDPPTVTTQAVNGIGFD